MENLKEDLLKALECAVCFHLMVPPITRCNNGHNICHTCKPRLENCPTCREEFTEVRNKFAEEFSESIEHPCKYKDSGCTGKFCLMSKEEHEKKCRYGPHKCPLIILSGFTCTWEGTSTELEQHIRNEHKDVTPVMTIMPGKRKTFNQDFTEHIEDGYWYQVVFTLDRLFFSYDKIIDNYFHMCYMFVGAREDNNNYRYSLSLKTADGNDSATACLECPNYQEFIDGEFPNRKCAVFDKDFTKLCVNDADELPVEYEISQN